MEGESSAAPSSSAPVNTGSGFPATQLGQMVVTEHLIGASPLGPPPGFSTPGGKRGRGRPKGSANKAKLPGASASSSADASSVGKDFTPHWMFVPPGEDVALTITSFAEEMSPKAVCVVSATGTVSSSFLSQPGSSVGIPRNDGECEIQALSGSFTYGENQSFGMLSVMLTRSDGSIVGGRVAGPLIAACPVMLVMGSFRQETEEEEKKPGGESYPMAEDTPPSGAPHQAVH